MRALVMERVAKRAPLFPDLPLDAIDIGTLDARDASLSRAIDIAVTRRWLTLVAIVQSRLDRPWPQVEPTLQAALLVGAAQLFFFDRVPDHAAVDESVNWAKGQRGPRGGGFVNAVLRKTAALRAEIVSADAKSFATQRDVVPIGDGRAWRLNEAVFAEDSATRLGQVASLSDKLVEHWIAAHGYRKASELAQHGLVDAPTLVTGVSAALAKDPRFAAHERGGWHVFTGEMSDLVALIGAHPTLRVQDPTSGDPVIEAQRAGLTPKLVVDACAGRGTKTVQLASAFPNATIVATDIDEPRRRDLAQVATRHANVRVSAPDQMSAHFRAADLVVLDVPCSNTGVLPRRPEAAYRFNARRLEQLVEKQRAITHGAMPLLKPGGAILYATCSLEPAENAKQAEALRKKHRLTAIGERQRFPNGVPGDPATRYSDGGFWALMKTG